MLQRIKAFFKITMCVNCGRYHFSSSDPFCSERCFEETMKRIRE